MEQKYSAGSLEYSVSTVSNSAEKSLDALISKLGLVSKELTSISSLAKSVSTTTGKGKTGGSASSYTRTTKKFLQGETGEYQRQLVTVTKTGKALEKVNQTFNEQGKMIKQITTSTDELGNTITKVSGSSGNKLFSASKWTNLLNKVYFLRNYYAQMFHTATRMLTNAIDYAETLNMWQVAMHGYREEAEDFVNAMNRAYGVSTQMLMQYQATFKNMVGSLGGINEDVSYQLSEYLVQMALDYASLYNIGVERAMITFRSMLSGETEPIRAIAGYDVTEITIYEAYKAMGGTKTMRQLTQVEKRLLRIYAVFQQMERSGAVGDLGKTIESTANQLRMFTESYKEFTTWMGIIVEQWLAPMLPYLNAFVMLLTDITKALAYASGYVAPDFSVTAETLREVDEELDKYQGKLLGFDKFSSLNTSEEDTSVGVDKTVLAGLSNITSILDSVTSKATELVDKWREWWFIEGDPQKGMTTQAENLLAILKAVGVLLIGLIALKIGKRLLGIKGKIDLVTASAKLLKFALAVGIISSLIRAIELFKEGDHWGGIFAMTIGVTLAGAWLYFKREMIKTMAVNVIAWFMTLNSKIMLLFKNLGMLISGMSKLELSLFKAGIATLGVVAGFKLFDSIIGSLQGTARKTVSIISMVAGSLATLLGIILAIKGGLKGGLIGASIAGLGVGALVAGIKGVATQNSQMQTFKTGGLVEDGLFTMSRGELVGDFGDGTTIVANNQQIIEGIKQGVYTAVRSAMANSGSGVIVLNVDSKELARATVTANASALSQNYRVDFKPR